MLRRPQAEIFIATHHLPFLMTSAEVSESVRSINSAISAINLDGDLPPKICGALELTCTAIAIFLSGKYIMSVRYPGKNPLWP